MGIYGEEVFEMARHAEKEANPLYPVPKPMMGKEFEYFVMKL